MPTTDFLSIKEFAALLKVHPDTIRRSIRNGRIGAIKVGGKIRSIYRIPNSEINRMAIIDLEKIICAEIEKRTQNNPKVL